MLGRLCGGTGWLRPVRLDGRACSWMDEGGVRRWFMGRGSGRIVGGRWLLVFEAPWMGGICRVGDQRMQVV